MVIMMAVATFHDDDIYDDDDDSDGDGDDNIHDNDDG
jgi:hypothetical protein